MTMNYKILWVDDTPDWVQPVRESIEEFMVDNGLSPSITFKTDGTDFETLIVEDDIDLIILDQGLPVRKGEDLIRSVRQNGEITEIVFYSQDDHHANPVNAWIGVSFSHRDDAEGAIKDVLKNFISRSTNMAVMRGVIIAEAIDVENKVTDIIKKLFADKADLFTAKILDKAFLDFSKKCNIVQSCLKDHLSNAQSAATKDEALITKLKNCADIMGKMQKEIVDQRNILAHSDKEADGSGNLVLKGLNKSTDKIVFDNAWRNDIRNNIRKHRRNLVEISKLI